MFWDLWFGGYDFELFDATKEALPGELMKMISGIMANQWVFIEAFHLRKKRYSWARMFSYGEEDEIHGKHGYLAAVRKMERKKGSLAKRFHGEKLYEIFDWNTYRRVVS